MIRYLLDTSPLAAYLLGRTPAVNLITHWTDRREVVTSIIAYGEVVEYIKGFPDYSPHSAELRELLLVIRPLVLTYRMLERYADIRRALRPAGNLIGDMDTLIAATALERNLILVTSDRHFQRVPGLSVMLIAPQQLRQ